MSDIIIVNFKQPILSYNFCPSGCPLITVIITPCSSTYICFVSVELLINGARYYRTLIGNLK